MRENFEYRGYGVSPNGSNYVARPLDDGDDFVLVSCEVERITQAIDQLWEALANGDSPEWFGDSAIDLDEPSIAEHFDERAQPIRQPNAKHQRVGQIVFALSMLAVATPLAMFMHFVLSECEPEIVFTLAVCAAAMIGTTLPAIILSVIAAGVYNFSHMPPVGTFTGPTREEVVYFLINILVAAAVPMFMEWLAEVRRARVRTPST
jgi:K+-sensing histidine kinase KdpD